MSKDLIGNNIVVENGCWIWQGGRDACNYGTLTVKGRGLRAHRVSAHLWNDFDLDSKLYVCHKCDNPPCCNPDHLFIGTQYDNMMDSLRKGRHVDNRGSKHGKAKINEDDVLLIRELSHDGWRPCDLARLFNLTLNHAVMIVTRRIWKHI